MSLKQGFFVMSLPAQRVYNGQLPQRRSRNQRWKCFGNNDASNQQKYSLFPSPQACMSLDIKCSDTADQFIIPTHSHRQPSPQTHSPIINYSPSTHPLLSNSINMCVKYPIRYLCDHSPEWLLYYPFQAEHCSVAANRAASTGQPIRVCPDAPVMPEMVDVAGFCPNRQDCRVHVLATHGWDCCECEIYNIPGSTGTGCNECDHRGCSTCWIYPPS